MITRVHGLIPHNTHTEVNELAKPKSREPSDSVTSSESKSESTTSDHSESQHESSPSRPFYYLKSLTRNKIDELEKIYDQPASDLESKLIEYKNIYWFFYIQNILAQALNLFSLVFLFQTCKEGMYAITEYFAPDSRISNEVIYSIGIPWALSDFLLFVFLFSPQYEAIKSTINYTLRKPTKQLLNEYYQELMTSPFKTLKNMSSYAINATILLSTNLTEAMTDIIDVFWIFQKCPPALYWLTILLSLYLGNVFYSNYTNDDYYEGLAFWKNEKKLSYLYQEIQKKNILIPIQIMIQATCVISLEIFPIYYYLAVAAKKELGWWIPPIMASILVAFHELCVSYPATYFHYMQYDIKLNEIINNPSLLPHHFHQTQEGVEQRKLAYLQAIHQEQSYFYLFKNSPLLTLSFLFKATIGGYLGYFTLNPLFYLAANEAISSMIFSTLTGASLFTATLYQIEKRRITTELAVKKVEISLEIPDENKQHSRLLKGTATFLNVGSGLANAASVIGIATRLFGTTSNYLLPFIGLIAIERMNNAIIFNMPKVEDSLAESFHSISSCGLFSKRNVVKDNIEAADFRSVIRPNKSRF